MNAFIRNKEDFLCEHCGTQVQGSGYTNHCPKCLWSKHVDIDPGDRAALCRALMEPIAVEGSTSAGYVIRHRCVACGHEKLNKLSARDSADVALEIVRRNAGQ